MIDKGWQFWVDRGGTFTDIIAYKPDGSIETCKLLSEHPELYNDAIIEGIRRLTMADSDTSIPVHIIGQIRVGTTIATNALLERKGASTAFVTSNGFADSLKIGYQQRPDLFALHIEKVQPLYEHVIETTQRISVNGETLQSLDTVQLKQKLQLAKRQGITSIAIAFLHAYAFPDDELLAKRVAESLDFDEVICSHELSQRMGFISRGETAVVDAYLSPIFHHYLNQLQTKLPGVNIQFMQSNGGLLNAKLIRAKDSLLSGPAGGVMASVKIAEQLKLDSIISFDMGGTSTDIGFYDGTIYRNEQPIVAGIPLRIPMLDIKTIASGGGSIIRYEQGRFLVGPESAGANPGPACYGRGGPLTITDCHVVLGNISPANFPVCFGDNGDCPIDAERVTQLMQALTDSINNASDQNMTIEQVARGFIQVAVHQMAAAIKKHMLKFGRDARRSTLICFGGAAGQHACSIAQELGIHHVIIHPLASLLSALGIGLAEERIIRQRSIEALLENCSNLNLQYKELQSEIKELSNNYNALSFENQMFVKYFASDNAFRVPHETQCRTTFERLYKRQYGYTQPATPIVCEAIAVEATSKASISLNDLLVSNLDSNSVDGPQRIVQPDTVIVINEGWQGTFDQHNILHIQHKEIIKRASISTDKADPVYLEVFNHAFMSIAEQMGETLVNTARSVNIKERRDFSCALFDRRGNLIANAPHMPVHLGSMSDSVKSIINNCSNDMKAGDAYMLNDPYAGGTHLPDITVITPVYFDHSTADFYVASRAHHADIGGIEPGSMPAHSTNIDQEGIVFERFKCVSQSLLLRHELLQRLTGGDMPARNPEKNIADLEAQLAANQQGIIQLQQLITDYGLHTVNAYVGFINDNAQALVENLLASLSTGSFTQAMDCGATIKVDIKSTCNNRCLIDFSKSGGAEHTNFNAPTSVTLASVLYVLRCLIQQTIPLNQGCLNPIDVQLPKEGLLNPNYPQAVVAGNVETSQNIVEALLSALGIMAQSQATMNNFTFGNDHYQYYETIAGGSGAGMGFNGCDAVQVHMTNTRLTDPEVLEHRFPVRLVDFKIRLGSGGAGQYRGGNGVIRCIEFLEPMRVNLLSEHRKNPPQGMSGGDPGQCGMNLHIKSGEYTVLPATVSIDVSAGDRICIHTPGGGGFGKPN